MCRGNRFGLCHDSAWYAAALFLMVGAFLSLAGTAAQTVSVQFDEFTDLVIADGIARDPLLGHDWDGSQARLPMYVTALAIRLLRFGGDVVRPLDALFISRWLSLAATALAILGTFLLGRRLFDTRTGMLGAALFAASPFVLKNGGSAMTEADAFTAPAVVLALLALVNFEAKRTTLRLFVLSMALAIAIGSKFYLVVLLPAIATYQLLAARFSLSLSGSAGGGEATHPPDAPRRRNYVLWSLGTGILAGLATVLSVGPQLGLEDLPANVNLASAAWLASLVCLCVCLVLAVRHDRVTPGRAGGVCWPQTWAWLAILPLTAAASLSLLPAHIFSPSVMPTLLERFLSMDGSSPFSVPSDAARVYLGIVLFKLGLPLGLATLVAISWALQEARRRRAALLLGSTLGWYALLLALLPLYQQFYLMSVYPILVMLLAAFIMRGLRAQRDWIRYAGATYFAVGVIWLGLGIVRVYPTFGVYGYETIGKDWLGSPSHGYRNVLSVTSDGTIEAMEWLRGNAVGGKVVSYLVDAHLIAHLDKLEPFPFEIRRHLHLPPADSHQRFVDIDFTVIRVVDGQYETDPEAEALFKQTFGTQPVFEVVRGRGEYRMSVVQIFSRRLAQDPGPGLDETG